MVMKKAFTLVEIIFVLVIMAVLSAGTFKAVEAIYTRSAQAKALTDLSLQSQTVLDQLSVLLYSRIANSVIGYTPGGACEPISELTTARPIIEWLATADDALLQGKYDGFVDMNASVKATFTLATPNSIDINEAYTNLVFAGAFDGGSEEISACKGAFGWHGNDSNLSYDITMGTDTINITDSVKPDVIYEKYYLTQTAYAVARGADIDLSSTCIADLDVPVDGNTLFLFYNYYPYATPSQTYCADGGEGNVTILAQDVTSFTAQAVNEVIRLSIDMHKEIRGRTCGVHVSKQKAVF
jgi:prepilin-type N-terminal cleavage/methylation domain-containing protein